jgi:hypothetical protein
LGIKERETLLAFHEHDDNDDDGDDDDDKYRETSL